MFEKRIVRKAVCMILCGLSVALVAGGNDMDTVRAADIFTTDDLPLAFSDATVSIANEGFESNGEGDFITDGTTPREGQWVITPQDSGRAERAEGVARTGSASFLLNGTSTSVDTWLQLKPNTTYEYGAWFKIPNGKQARVRLFWTNSIGGTTNATDRQLIDVSPDGQNEWVEAKNEFTTGSENYYIKLGAVRYVDGASADVNTGDVYVDDFFIQEKNPSDSVISSAELTTANTITVRLDDSFQGELGEDQVRLSVSEDGGASYELDTSISADGEEQYVLTFVPFDGKREEVTRHFDLSVNGDTVDLTVVYLPPSDPVVQPELSDKTEFRENGELKLVLKEAPTYGVLLEDLSLTYEENGSDKKAELKNIEKVGAAEYLVTFEKLPLSAEDRSVLFTLALNGSSLKKTLEIPGVPGTIYYVDADGGNDSNSGTSPEKAWKSLTKVSASTFGPNDQILLKSGCVWEGQQLWPKGSGASGAPIKIDKYGGDELPKINGSRIKWAEELGLSGTSYDYSYNSTVHLRNQEYWEIRNLDIANDDDFDVDIELVRAEGDNSFPNKMETMNGIGLVIDCNELGPNDDGIMNHIVIENCYIHNVDGPNDWNRVTCGAITYCVYGDELRPSTAFHDIRIAYNTIKTVDLLGVMGQNRTTTSTYQDEIGPNNLWFENTYIGHNYFEDIGQGAIDLCVSKNSVVEHNIVDGFLTRYPTFRPTVAMYPWKCEDSVFQYNEVFNGPSTNADGSPYDMDSALKNVVYQFNYSHNNPCGWMLYMGKNDNDIIRYNISDDGGDYVIKYFLTANTTPAYFINNVIMYDGGRTKFMFRDPFKSQTYFYNNIFYNKSTTTTTDWHSRLSGTEMGPVTFSNNCFYEASGIHAADEPEDLNKVTEDPKMVNPGQEPQKDANGILTGASIFAGYQLQSDSPLIDAGVYVPQMGDADFFGNKLYWGDAPDIGVHEVEQGQWTDVSQISGNLLKGSTVTASENIVTHENFPLANMVDGVWSEQSRWASKTSDVPMWLEFTLQGETQFNRLVMGENIVDRYASSRIADLEIQVPDGNGKWKTVASFNGQIGSKKEFTFDSVTADKVRLVINELREDTAEEAGNATNPSIVEVELYYIPEPQPEPEQPADTARLTALVENAEAIDKELYTADSVKVLEDALRKAKDLLADGTLTQEDQVTVDAAADRLQAALDGLVEKGQTPVSDAKPGQPVSGGPNSTTPQTGDNTMAALAFLCCLMCISGAAITVVIKKRGSH